MKINFNYGNFFKKLVLILQCLLFLGLSQDITAKAIGIAMEEIPDSKNEITKIQSTDSAIVKIINNEWKQATKQEVEQLKICLSLLIRKGAIIANENNIITSDEKKLSNQLLANIDFTMFPLPVLKYLIDSNIVCFNSDWSISNKSHHLITEFYHYTMAIDDAKKKNMFSQKINCLDTVQEEMNSNDQKYLNSLIHDFKTKYYTQNMSLVSFDKSNKLIVDTLINGKRHLLMLAWKKKGYEKFLIAEGKNQYKSNDQFFNYPLFLTAAYEMQRFICKNLPLLDEDKRDERLCEVLGLPPLSKNNQFYEFWIAEADLFRPGIDSSLNSTQLICRPSMNYTKALYKFSYGSYSSADLVNQYPFTGLGYTYDYNYNNPTHFGVSEFVLLEGRTFYIRSQKSTTEYIAHLCR